MLGSDLGDQRGIDPLNRGTNDRGGLLPPFGEAHHETAPILWIDLAAEIPAGYEAVHELTGGLLGGTQLGDYFAQWRIRPRHCAENEDPVARDVIATGVGECRVYRGPVHGSGSAHQRRHRDVLEPLISPWHSVHHMVQDLDSQSSVLRTTHARAEETPAAGDGAAAGVWARRSVTRLR